MRSSPFTPSRASYAVPFVHVVAPAFRNVTDSVVVSPTTIVGHSDCVTHREWKLVGDVAIADAPAVVNDHSSVSHRPATVTSRRTLIVAAGSAFCGTSAMQSRSNCCGAT